MFNRKLDFDDVLIVPKSSTISSRREVMLTEWIRFKYSDRNLRGVPIIAANMANIGTPQVAKVMNEHHMLTALHKDYDVDMPNSFLTYGIQQGFVASDEPYLICLDVANGYMEKFLDYVEDVRILFPNAVIMAGNVATPEGTINLIEAGADIVKVGIGSGAACTTRIKTGIGYPQFSAVYECADAAKTIGGHVCSDGGHRTPGDVAKSFTAGAGFVMLGGMLAGTYETGTRFYGSSSEAAKPPAKYATSEGRVVDVQQRGYLSMVLADICGGLRSACSYVGAKSLLELPDKAEFIKVGDTHNRIMEKQ